MSLEIMLKELHLRSFQHHLKDFQQQAIDKTWSYTDFLTKLCEEELARRFQVRVATWTREARLPAGKSFANLTLSDLPATAQQAGFTSKKTTSGHCRQKMSC